MWIVSKCQGTWNYTKDHACVCPHTQTVDAVLIKSQPSQTTHRTKVTMLSLRNLVMLAVLGTTSTDARDLLRGGTNLEEVIEIASSKCTKVYPNQIQQDDQEGLCDAFTGILFECENDKKLCCPETNVASVDFGSHFGVCTKKTAHEPPVMAPSRMAAEEAPVMAPSRRDRRLSYPSGGCALYCGLCSCRRCPGNCCC